MSVIFSPRPRIVALTIAACCLAATAQAADPGNTSDAHSRAASADVARSSAARDSGSRRTLDAKREQRLREELRVLLLDMVQSGALDASSPDQVDLSIEEPPQRVGSLGVLVDSAGADQARDGLHVLATTPGGSAERMGLRAGDVITAVNGVTLAGLGSSDDGSARAAALLREQVAALDAEAELAFDVRRDGRGLNVRGPLVSTWLPALRLSLGSSVALAANAPATKPAGGCGRVSIVDVAPRQQGLHAVSLNQIDGGLAGVTNQTSFRLPVGEHVLEVGERIEPRYLPFNDRQRNRSEPRYKRLVVQVTADTTSFVAAQLNEDKRSEWSGGGYWDPVVWREAAEPCR